MIFINHTSQDGINEKVNINKANETNATKEPKEPKREEETPRFTQISGHVIPQVADSLNELGIELK